MKRIATRGSVALTALALALGLAGCSSEGDIDLSSPGAIRNAACEDIQSSVDKLTELVDENTSPGKRNRLERELNVDVNDKGQLDDAMAALNERAEACGDNDSETEPSSTTSPSESSSSSPSSTPTTDPDDTPTVEVTSGIVGWDQLPSEARQRVKEHRSEIRFTAEDTRTWAVTTLPSGNLADARVVLVFGLPDVTDAEARDLADVKRRTEVVRVDTCTDIVGQGCVENEIRVILAPLVLEDGVVKGIKRGSGVMLNGNFPLITYTS